MNRFKTLYVLLFLIGILAGPVGVIALSSSSVGTNILHVFDSFYSDAGPVTDAEFYLPDPILVDLPAPQTIYVTEDGKLVLPPSNTIYAEFSGLSSSEILNKIVDLVEARDVRWGFYACNTANLSNTFLPFNEYLKIRFIEDNGAAMILANGNEMATVLSPWGIQISNSGRLEISEDLLVGEMLYSVLYGNVGMCWGNATASELIIYGNVQSLFDTLSAKYVAES